MGREERNHDLHLDGFQSFRFLCSSVMSLIPPHLLSPAATPDDFQPSPSNLSQPSELDQARLRSDIEAQLLRLSQDLYEMEICAGEVGAGMEDAVPNYLYESNRDRRQFR